MSLNYMPIETTVFKCELICHHLIAQKNGHSIAHTISQKKIHEHQGSNTSPIEGVQWYRSNSAIHLM